MRNRYNNRMVTSRGRRSSYRSSGPVFTPGATTMSYTRGGITKFLPIIAVAALLFVIAFIGYSCATAAPVHASINGNRVGLEENTTVAMAITQEAISTTPGRLLAVDGSVIKEAGGTPFTVQINGQNATPSTVISDRDDIVITPGQDITESYSEKVFVDTSEVMAGDTWGAIKEIAPTEPDAAGLVAIGDISGLMVEKKKPSRHQVGVINMFNVETSEKVMALTFDDGPWEETTEQILDILKEHDAKATFFVLGTNIDSSPEMAALVKREHDEGHQVCTHTYSHAAGSGGGYDMGLMSPEERVEEVLKGQEAIAKATGAPADHMFRSPGGNFSTYTAHDISPYISYEIGWNVDSEDWRKPGAEAIAASLLAVQPGNIVLMHDGGGERSQTVEALRSAMPKLKEAGWKFVTVNELLKYNKAESSNSSDSTEDAEDY